MYTKFPFLVNALHVKCKLRIFVTKYKNIPASRAVDGENKTIPMYNIWRKYYFTINIKKILICIFSISLYLEWNASNFN